MNYYICKIFHLTTSFILEVCVILTHHNNCSGTEFWLLLLPSCHKVKESQPIKPSQILSEVLNSLFLYLEMLVTLIFDSLSVLLHFFFFPYIQEFEKTLSKCGGTEIFYYFSYFLNSRNTKSVFWGTKIIFQKDLPNIRNKFLVISSHYLNKLNF